MNMGTGRPPTSPVSHGVLKFSDNTDITGFSMSSATRLFDPWEKLRQFEVMKALKDRCGCYDFFYHICNID